MPGRMRIVLMKDGKVLCQGAPEAVCRETELERDESEEPALYGYLIV